MSDFGELNRDLAKAQSDYEKKAGELAAAQAAKEEAEIAMIRSDSTYKRLRLETSVAKTKIESLREISWNVRRENAI